MPHHFKWINRATLLFNLASAELVVGCADAHARACQREGGSERRRCDQRCTGLSVFVTEGQTDGRHKKTDGGMGGRQREIEADEEPESSRR